MSKEQFNKLREIEVLEAVDVSREVQEEIVIELTQEFEVIDQSQTVISDASNRFEEMPRDFWNYGYNGHSGFIPDNSEKEEETIRRYFK